MDLAYDHIQEAAFPKDKEESSETSRPEQQEPSLNNELQDAYKAISSSAWGMRIGGFLGSVVKQGESVYAQAQKELAEVGGDATKGLTDLRDSLMSRTRSLSPSAGAPADAAAKDEDEDDARPAPRQSESNPRPDAAGPSSETVLSRLRAEASKRIKDLQRAEDAADEALLRFGTNVRDFLRDAISVAPPDESSSSSSSSQPAAVLFESKDAQGKRVIHTSRFDAQMHVIHTSLDGFTKDPSGDEFNRWVDGFDVTRKTDAISQDLVKYPELKASMEKLVPEKVPCAEFWRRYYFLRHGIETAESRRRDLLNAASAEDEVGWDDDSDDEGAGAGKKPAEENPSSGASSTTIQRPPALLKPNEALKLHDEKSQADSEASYDVVGATSGKTTQAPNSPKDSKKGDESDDDWE
ncbi:uncharacterized protein UV8b_06145 [Ustilaginoidea virens]|uniref:BSD domain-containing protein n=1 Tax=Ustilaginoidea virens TaxID=1159556 RepID=A0A063C9T8_USTVR|nr:uncharacterized protein UV8b_06145 [Ustilaginoidea virens]QUC21904.1 hypothetical protein UV8b_06145 [Ustilaginoidea virens]GAO17420.1 hypothetical protein UVI_02024020 [Ustilaginoidea virens]